MSYLSSHQKIYKIRGKASEYACIGCSDQASQWAYNHQDPNEVVGTWDGRSAVYSDDSKFYDPMCARCHAQRDSEHRGSSGNKNELKTHCKENHEYTDENTRIDKKGTRHCKSCHREKERVRYRKLRENGMSWSEIRKNVDHG